MRSLLNHVVVFFFISLPLTGMGQEYRMEAHIQANSFVITEHNQQHVKRRLASVPVGISGSVSYNLTSYLNVGVTYAKSVRPGTQAFHETEHYDSYSSVADTDLNYLMYGATIRLSTNNDKKLSVYGTGKYLHMELLEEFPDFSLISEGPVISAGIGLNFKITRHVNFTLFEFSYMWLDKNFNIYNEIPENALFLQSGLSVKFSKKRPGAKW